MHDSLNHTLQVAVPREKSGSRTSARYDYQAHCGLLKLFELRDQQDDFRMVFDYFDDILILDRSREPQTAQLYQVKTKDTGEWSTAKLCSLVGKLAPRSIFARLYDHVVLLGDPVTETSFISNAAFTVKLKSGSNSTGEHHWIAGDDIHDDDVEKIRTAIEKDIAPCDIKSWLPRLVLIRSPMGIHGQKTYVIGVLHEYFAKKLSLPDVSLEPLYETLYETIHECTRFSQDGLTTEQLIQKKSITKSDVDALIERATHRRASFLSDWTTISHDLSTVGIRSVRQIRLRTFATQHMTNRSIGHPIATDLSDAARSWAAKNYDLVSSSETIYELANVMADHLHRPEVQGDELLGAMLAEAYEVVNGQ